MPTVTTIDTFNGRICGQSTNGVMTNYMTDALGSVTATVNQSQSVENTYRYKPYGAMLAKTGTAADPDYLWTGDTGSRPTGLAQAGQYNEARHYNPASGNWTTVDPIWPRQRPYCYAGSNPVAVLDPSGRFLVACAVACAGAALCAAELWAVCRDYSGFKSFSDCAWQTFNNLPGWLKFLCGGSAAACIVCLGGEALKILLELKEAQCKALQYAYHVACPGYRASATPDTTNCDWSDGCGALAFKSAVWAGCCAARTAIYLAGCPDDTSSVLEHHSELWRSCAQAAVCLSMYTSKCGQPPAGHGSVHNRARRANLLGPSGACAA